jgi:WD40 repeat protein
MTKTTQDPHQAPAVAERIPLSPVDPKQTHQTAEFKGGGRPLTCVRLDPAGPYAFAGAEDFSVYRWHLPTGKMVKLDGHRSWVRSMDVSPDGKTTVTADWQGTLCWWPTDTADAKTQPLRKLVAHQGSCRWVRFSPDGERLATCGNDNLVKLWTATGEPIAELPGHARHPYAVAFHPDHPELASEDLVGVVKAWDMGSMAAGREVTLSVMTGYDKTFVADMGGARDLAFSADGRTLACAGITNVKNAFAGVQDPIVVLVDWEKLQSRQEYRAASNFQGIAWGVRVHEAGFVLGCGAKQSGQGALWFWQGEKKEPFHTLDTKSACRGLDLFPDTRRVAVAHADGALRLYEMAAKA